MPFGETSARRTMPYIFRGVLGHLGLPLLSRDQAPAAGKRRVRVARRAMTWLPWPRRNISAGPVRNLATNRALTALPGDLRRRGNTKTGHALRGGTSDKGSVAGRAWSRWSPCARSGQRIENHWGAVDDWMPVIAREIFGEIANMPTSSTRRLRPRSCPTW